jgi:hypothetical protein
VRLAGPSHLLPHFATGLARYGGERPKDIGAGEIRASLSHPAVVGRVGASIQNVAFSAPLFLYREVLHLELLAMENEELAQYLTSDTLHRGRCAIQVRRSQQPILPLPRQPFAHSISDSTPPLKSPISVAIRTPSAAPTRKHPPSQDLASTSRNVALHWGKWGLI